MVVEIVDTGASLIGSNVKCSCICDIFQSIKQSVHLVHYIGNALFCNASV